MGWEVSFFWPVAVLDVVAAPVEGGGPTLPLWGRVVTYDDGMRYLLRLIRYPPIAAHAVPSPDTRGHVRI